MDLEDVVCVPAPAHLAGDQLLLLYEREEYVGLTRVRVRGDPFVDPVRRASFARGLSELDARMFAYVPSASLELYGEVRHYLSTIRDAADLRVVLEAL